MNLFCPVEKSLWLQRVCEANFERLTDLVPDLDRLGGVHSAGVRGKPNLHLRLLERSVYTLTLELTHDFSFGKAPESVPAVRIRVCFDSRTAEVLSDHSRPHVFEALREEPSSTAILDYKWSLNYFLARWLDHCLYSQYRFSAVESKPECLAAE